MEDRLVDMFTAGEFDPEAEDKPVTAVEIVINYIRTEILKKKLRMGDKLPTEGELCDMLGVGRGSVREAIKRLEAMQLLDVRRGDGTYVAHLDDVTAFDTMLYKVVLEDIDFQQIIDYRIQLEICIMQLAIRNCTQETLEKLRGNFNEFRDYVTGPGREKDSAHIHNLDMEFHSLLGEASGNRLLVDVYGASLRLFSPYIYLNYQKGQLEESPYETIENHRLLLSALEKRDFTAAIHAVVDSATLWSSWVDAAEKEK